MTVLENLLVASNLSSTYAIQRSRELLKMSDLDELENEQARNLSFGQKKQLEFDRMLLMESDLILLDEPNGRTHACYDSANDFEHQLREIEWEDCIDHRAQLAYHYESV